MFPQNYDIPTLTFGDECGRKKPDPSYYFMIGVLALLVFVTMTQPMSTYRRPMGTLESAKSALNNVATGVSAKIADVMASKSDPTIVASAVYPNAGGVALLDAPSAAKNPDAYKSLSADEKKKIGVQLDQWLNQRPSAMVMLFAPWCPHCHDAMSTFSGAASKINAKNAIMVNAETLPAEMIMGEQARLLPLEYYPTFAVKSKHSSKLNRVGSPNEAVSQMNEASATAARVAPMEPLDDDESSQAAESSPFDSLF